MSRVGKYPVTIPDGVTLKQDGNTLTVKGKRGEMSYLMSHEVETIISDNEVTIKPRDTSKGARSM